MSSVKDAKLGSRSSTLVRRCHLSGSHLYSYTVATNDCSLPLRSPLVVATFSTHTLLGYTVPSAHFNLERGSSTSQHYQDSPVTLLPHLPAPPIKTVHIHQIQNAELGFAAKVLSPVFCHTPTCHTRQHLPKLFS